LSCCIPESELDGFAVDAAVGYVVLEDGGYISLYEEHTGLVNEKRSLAACAVTYDDELSRREGQTLALSVMAGI
jgi:hypothetical protein